MDAKRALAAGIVLVITLTVLGAVIDNYAPGKLNTPEWEYDGYKAAADIRGGAAAASGSLELVEISGVTMVHAKSMGKGTITHTDGTKEDVTVEKAVVDVFLLIGQSNANYRPGQADTEALSPKPVPGTAYYYGTPESCSQWDSPSINRVMSFNLEDGSPRLGDKMPAIAAAYHEETGRKMLLIDSAIGGTRISTFEPEDGANWVRARTAVITTLQGIEASGCFVASGTYAYMFIQGESDGTHGTSKAAYMQSFMKMHDAILDGGLGAKFGHCYISLTQKGMAPAQRQLAEDHPDTITVATYAALQFTAANGMLSDAYHYTQPGDNIIGEALGKACAQYVKGSDVLSTLIDLIPALVAVAGVVAVAIYILQFRQRY